MASGCRGWLKNRVLSEISIRRGRNVTLLQLTLLYRRFHCYATFEIKTPLSGLQNFLCYLNENIVE